MGRGRVISNQIEKLRTGYAIFRIAKYERDLNRKEKACQDQTHSEAGSLHTPHEESSATKWSLALRTDAQDHSNEEITNAKDLDPLIILPSQSRHPNPSPCSSAPASPDHPARPSSRSPGAHSPLPAPTPHDSVSAPP